MTMDFMTAVKTCLTQKYATFSGRASRSEYWWFFLAAVIGAFVAALLGPLSMIYGLAMICPMLAAGYRRLQDTGRPGWWIVIPATLNLIASLLAPDMPDEAAMASGDLPGMGAIALSGILSLIGLVVALVFIWFLTRPSDPGPNQYGPPPTASA